jgi:hypothetical protein
MRRGGNLIALGLLAASCAHRPFDRSVPIGSPSSGQSVEDVPVRGHVITLSTRRGSITGELLAVGPREVIILGDDDGQIVQFSEIEDIDIKLYHSDESAAGVWTGLGTASALTHGMFALITIPVWLISGISVTQAEATRSRVEGVELATLYQYARFPQGLPRLPTQEVTKPVRALPPPPPQLHAPEPVPVPVPPLPDAGVAAPVPPPAPLAAPSLGSGDARPDAGP